MQAIRLLRMPRNSLSSSTVAGADRPSTPEQESQPVSSARQDSEQSTSFASEELREGLRPLHQPRLDVEERPTGPVEESQLSGSRGQRLEQQREPLPKKSGAMSAEPSRKSSRQQPQTQEVPPPEWLRPFVSGMRIHDEQGRRTAEAQAFEEFTFDKLQSETLHHLEMYSRGKGCTGWGWEPLRILSLQYLSWKIYQKAHTVLHSPRSGNAGLWRYPDNSKSEGCDQEKFCADMEEIIHLLATYCTSIQNVVPASTLSRKSVNIKY